MKLLKNILKFITSFFLYLLLNIIFSNIFINDIKSSNIVLSNLSQISVCIISLTIFIFMFRKIIINDFFNFKRKYLETGFNYWIIGIFIMMLINVILSLLGGSSTFNEDANRNIINKFLPYSIVALSLYAPIMEELLFRAGLRDIFKNKYFYAICSGLIFGSLHVLNELINFTSIISILYILPYAFLGFIFALLYYKTNNIWSSIIYHSLHNSIAIFLLLIAR